MKKLIFTIILLCLLMVGCTDDETKYTVTFDEDGGSSVADITQAKNSNVNLPTTSKLGYDFVGWFLDDEKITSISSLDQDITLIAKWNVINYSITYNLAGGINHNDNPISYTIESIIQLKDPSKDGGEFSGWYNGTTKVTEIKNQTGNLVLTAKWNVVTYKINYNLDGGVNNSNNPSEYLMETDFVLLSPTKENHIFLGWYNGDTLINNINQLEGDITLVAKWEFVVSNLSLALQESNFESYELDFTIKRGKLSKFSKIEKKGNAVVLPQGFHSVSNQEIYVIEEDGFLFMIQLENGEYKKELLTNMDFELTIGASVPNLFLFEPECFTFSDGKYYLNSFSETNDVVKNILKQYSEINMTVLLEDCYIILTDNVISEFRFTMSWIDGRNGAETMEYTYKYSNYGKTNFTIPEAKDETYIKDGIAYEINGDVAKIIRVSKNLTDFAPPRLIDDKRIVEIGEYAFSNSALTSITIRSSVITIAQNAFEWCMLLTSIYAEQNNQFHKSIDGNLYSKDGALLIQYATGKPENHFVIPKSVTDISAKAFSNTKIETISFEEGSKCRFTGSSALLGTQIKTINFPSSLTDINEGSFYYYRLLTTINVDSNNQYYKSIDGNLYSKDGSTLYKYAIGKEDKSFFVPSNITDISEEAFEGCALLTAINVDSNNQYYKSIDGNLYSKNGSHLIQYATGKSEDHFVIPKSVTEINSAAFLDAKINTVTFQAGSKLEYIGTSMFWDSQITSITIPASVVNIESYAFLYSSIKTINFEADSKLELIDSYAFYGALIESIIIPKNVELINNQVFTYSRLQTIDFEAGSKLTEIGEYMLAGTSVTSITIPKNVTHIQDYAFAYSSLQTINFESGSKLESIGSFAFIVSNITEIMIPKSVVEIKEGILSGLEISTIAFEGESRLEIIGDYAFANSKFETIIIPKSVNRIGQYAFEKALIQTISFEGGSNLRNIGLYAFYESQIKEIIIPSSVITIDEYAFAKSSLHTITFAEGSKLDYIGANAFEETQITTITIPSTVNYIGQYAFVQSKLQEITIEADSQLESIRIGLFSHSQLTSITIPSSVTSIGEYAFGYSNLNTITFAENSKLEFIGEIAFKGTQITTITIPNTVRSIGESAFQNSNIEVVNFEADCQLKTLSSGLFSHSQLTSITIPSSITYIGQYAFAYSNLSIVAFEEGSGLEYIGSNAFYESEIKEIIIPSSVKTIVGHTFAKTPLNTIIFEEDSQLETIGSYPFADSQITTITIPSSVSKIYEDAFSNVEFLTTIYVDSNNNYYKSIDGNLYSKDGSQLIVYAPGKTDESFVIPSSVTKIEYRAFYNSQLETIIFESGSKLERIENEAFREAKITKITIPSSVTYIGRRAFYGWEREQIINFQGPIESAETWENGWDYYCFATINWNA